VPANELSWFGKVVFIFPGFGNSWRTIPGSQNTEGGIFPAIFGTVMMVMIMSVLVVPLGRG